MDDKKICAHERILTWYDEETGEPVGLWSCAGCHRKFAPMEPVGINGLTETDRSDLRVAANIIDRDGPSPIGVELSATLRRIASAGVKGPTE